MQRSSKAAARRSSNPSGDSRRSCFVAHRHKRSLISSACRVSLRLSALAHAARLDNTTHERESFASIDTQKPRVSLLRAPAITPLVTNLQYTALNQPKAWNWNCVTGNLYTPTVQPNCDTATRSFDADGRMSSNEIATLQYDGASRITAITQNLWASRTVTQTVGTETTVVTQLYQVPFTWTASYDSRSRLTSFNLTAKVINPTRF